MNSQINISVVIPIYNNEKYIDKCINSILKQTFQNFEIICIDDNSTDNSYEILKSYEKKDSRIKLLKNLENLGAGKTKNIGLETAKGKYILFIDSDDYIKEETLERLFNKALELDADYIGYNMIRIYEDNDKTIYSSAQTYKDKYFQSMSACTKLYKKNFLLEKQIQFDPLRSGEDMIMAFKVFAFSQKYDWIDFDGYFYLQRNGSLTKIKKEKKEDDLLMYDIFQALRNIDSFLNEVIDSDEIIFLKTKFNQIKVNYLFYHYQLRDKSNKEEFYNRCIKFLENEPEYLDIFKSKK